MRAFTLDRSAAARAHCGIKRDAQVRFPPVDVSRFPLVYCRYPITFEAGDIDEFIKDLEEVYKRGKLAIVVNIDNVQKVNARLRMHIARRIDELTLRYKGTVLAEAIIVSSAPLRAGVTAYTWFKIDKSYPTKCFKSEAEGVTWACDILAQHGMAARSTEAPG